jgi:hypothetical protein
VERIRKSSGMKRGVHAHQQLDPPPTASLNTQGFVGVRFRMLAAASSVSCVP